MPMSNDGYICEDCYARSPDSMHILELKRGTRTLDVAGDIVKLIEVRETGAPTLPAYTALVGDAYNFTPSHVTFNKAVMVTLGYNVVDLDPDVVAVNMYFYNSDDGWNPLQSTSKQVAEIGSLSAEVTHFTIFANLADVPGFEVSNLSITPSRTEIWPFLTFIVRIGDEADVSVDVENTGNHQATHTVALNVNGATRASQEVILADGENAQVLFQLVDNGPGRYVVVVEGLTGEFSQTLWINWWLIIGLLAALAALIWFFVWLYRRNRGTA